MIQQNTNIENIQGSTPEYEGLVIADLPKAGLGNKLFAWAKAYLFAKENKLPLYVKGLNQVSIGTFLRKERVKRFYLGQFKFNNNNVTQKYYLNKIKRCKTIVENDGNIKYLAGCTNYVFNEIPHWGNRFGSINEYREMVIPAFYELLSKRIKNSIIENNIRPDIGMHIRMGDFKQLLKNQNFKNVGGVRTPLEYFVKCIHEVRTQFNENLPVTVFSDGYPHEMKAILDLPNVKMAPPAPDVIDLIRLSRSKLIFTSAGSSFGEWAGYLSDAPVIIHPDHIHGRIRHKKYGLYEGSLDNYFKSDSYLA